MSPITETLAELLALIRDLDPSYPANDIAEDRAAASYAHRNGLIYQALYLADTLDYPCGIAVGDSADWPVVFIELPTGQVSWHLPSYPVAWDGHTTEEKYARITRFTTTTRI
jgi:hypothetical protein